MCGSNSKRIRKFNMDALVETSRTPQSRRRFVKVLLIALYVTHIIRCLDCYEPVCKGSEGPRKPLHWRYACKVLGHRYRQSDCTNISMKSDQKDLQRSADLGPKIAMMRAVKDDVRLPYRTGSIDCSIFKDQSRGRHDHFEQETTLRAPSAHKAR